MAHDPFAPKPKRENKIERGIVQVAEYYGWFSFKIVSPSFNGMPDRGFVKEGEHFTVVECKRFGETPTKLQKIRAQQLKEKGVRVYWLDNIEGAHEIFGNL